MAIETIKQIKVNDLRVGMYVVLTKPWLDHPFYKNDFLISSEKQLKKILKLGLEDVLIDTGKGRDVDRDTKAYTAEIIEDKEPSEKEINQNLIDAISSKRYSSEEKAGIVYKRSVDLIKVIFDNPVEEVISEGKKGLYNVVELFLTDYETTNNLIRSVSHINSPYIHSVNVGVYSVALSKQLFKGTACHDMHELGAAFFLHDIGKARIDSAIVNKTGKFTDAEMKEMQAHPVYGYKLLEETGHLTGEAGIVTMQHHERHDGSGYPLGLEGVDIHEYGRICCIADVYDAMTSRRFYKKELGSFKALQVMKEEMAGHFSKEMFEKFVLLFF